MALKADCKILHLQTELNKTCGVTKSILTLILNTDKYFKHSVLTLGGNNIKAFDQKSINVVHAHLKNILIINHLYLSFLIYAVCKKNNINLIHAHHRYLALAAFIPCKLLGIPLIITVQSKVYGFKRLSYKADAVIAVSQSIKNHLTSYFGINPDKIYLINNFTEQVNYDKLDLPNIRAQLKVDESQKIIVFIGRFSKEKGVDILVECFKEVQLKKPDSFLCLVGDGPEKEYLQNFIKANSLNASLFEPVDNIYDFYKIADIIVLPSRVDPFPLVMLEAGMMKKPFVGSNVDGIAELVENEIEGLLVEPGNSRELADSILHLLDDNEKAGRLARNLYNKVMSGYRVENILLQYEKLYNSLINERK